MLVEVLAMLAMATGSAPQEVLGMRLWIHQALFRQSAPTERCNAVSIRRQDYGRLQVNKSVMGTPLKLGSKTFPHGLGTHAVSEMNVQLEKPGGTFEAVVGVDNNYNTLGVRGSAEFAVEIAGQVVFRSGVRKSNDPPLPVSVDLGDASEFTLWVFDGGDGPQYDQSDWADAKVKQGSKTILLDEMSVSYPPVVSKDAPFSLLADGKVINDWKSEIGSKTTGDGWQKTEVLYRNSEHKLLVQASVTSYDKFPVADWTLKIKNEGDANSPILSDIHPLDIALTPPVGNLTVHSINGSTTTPDDFIPYSVPIPEGFKKTFAPTFGRSSQVTAPFFNFQWDGGGMVLAIGWSGQWSMDVERAGASIAVSAGQQTTHFRLKPGEEVRTPRIAMLRWDGDDMLKGQNMFRQFVLNHVSPKVDGKPVVNPIAQNTWFTYSEGNNVTEANQLEAIDEMAKIGVEAYWLDAGWFKGGWPAGAGNWDPKEDAFPNGLKPLGDAAHKAGMKFVLWFEPERVVRTSPIFKEHREWVLEAGGGDCLFDLGNPEARQWLTQQFLERFKKWGVDVYRNDFNINPLPFWQAKDEPERKGISEIRYVEGLYQMWDDFLAGKPGLTIDNCASGGRRIDLEMTARSYPLWQSDTQCAANCPSIQDQDQNLGLSLYLPLHSGGVWGFDPYRWRSIVTVGTSLCLDQKGKYYDREAAKKMISEAKRLRPYLLGDFYPLLRTPKDHTVWVAWQYDRPDLGEGTAVAFRRQASPYTSATLELKAIDPKAKYEVDWVDRKKKQVLSGKELQALKVEIAAKEQSVLVVYKKMK